MRKLGRKVQVFFVGLILVIVAIYLLSSSVARSLKFKGFTLPEGFEAVEATEIERKTSLAKEIVCKRTGIEMVLILPGEFVMGNPYYYNDRHGWVFIKPHKVRITKPFYMGKYEVTVGQFRKFVEATGYQTDYESRSVEWKMNSYSLTTDREMPSDMDIYWDKPGFEQNDDFPVVCVGLDDAKAYCEWAGFSLPTEAQWEYACRAGTNTEYYFGDTITHDDANYHGIGEKDSWATTAPVGSFPPNAWGLYDMHGNVMELARDYYMYEFHLRAVTDPVGEINTPSVRGGGWADEGSRLTSYGRCIWTPRCGTVNLGFRVIKELE